MSADYDVTPLARVPGIARPQHHVLVYALFERHGGARFALSTARPRGPVLRNLLGCEQQAANVRMFRTRSRLSRAAAPFELAPRARSGHTHVTASHRRLGIHVCRTSVRLCVGLSGCIGVSQHLRNPPASAERAR